MRTGFGFPCRVPFRKTPEPSMPTDSLCHSNVVKVLAWGGSGFSYASPGWIIRVRCSKPQAEPPSKATMRRRTAQPTLRVELDSGIVMIENDREQPDRKKPQMEKTPFIRRPEDWPFPKSPPKPSTISSMQSNAETAIWALYTMSLTVPRERWTTWIRKHSSAIITC